MAGDAIPCIHVTLYSERIMPVVVVRDAATAQATADGTPASAVAPPAPPGATPGMLHDATPGIQAADEMEVDDTDTTPTITAATSWPALPATAQHRQHAALPDAPGEHNASNHVLVPPGIGMEPPRPPATTYAGSVCGSTSTTTAPPQRVPPRAATHPPTAPNGAVPLGSGARPAAAATALPPPDQVVQVHSPMMLDDVIAWLQSTAARGDIGNEVTFQYACGTSFSVALHRGGAPLSGTARALDAMRARADMLEGALASAQADTARALADSAAAGVA